ncbi:MAG: phenylalanine--tRNA ligase subunit beta [Woeseiaceae bacterium]|nr:phenylalanine--tRNA ligase subunit beta [Woeseiaceae bacterium]
MKFSEKWLREWVNPKLDSEGLAHRLTMAGLEVEALEPQGAGLDGIVVGEVLDVKKHPDADKLSVCRVSTGKRKPVEVVCGAPNVVAGMKSPFAPPGTTLPNGLKLEKATIRGVQSNGMLCSEIELGLGDDADGIISLPVDARTGQSLLEYLELPDVSFDLDLTPNRGDCFSVLGIARDVSALTSTPLTGPTLNTVAATIDDQHPVELVMPEGCPRFAARVIRGIDTTAKSPVWMTERLRRSGLRPIHPVVDVTNYVMLELGQPLHAYDLNLLKGPIRPRLAKSGEKVTLLDGRDIEVNSDTLVITDDSGAIGLAGIMGGLSTAVSENTSDVFFEAAFWPPAFMLGRARQYALHTDASLRFERGVDPAGQARAIERATELLLEIAGGKAGPLADHVVEKHLPAARSLALRKSRLKKVLGADIEPAEVSEILTNLGMSASVNDEGWQVDIPSYRFDIDVEDALVEEVARIYGYDEIPETTAIGETPLALAPETSIDLDVIANLLVARDYQEVITYSFVDQALDARLSGAQSELVLSNPISSEMSVMRSSVWPGLLTTAAGNVARQQDRVRIFEIGKTYHGSLKKPREVLRVAGLAYGPAAPEQWGSQATPVDFFDLKADVVALLATVGSDASFEFDAIEHTALQPGQAAQISRGDEVIGICGKLHPQIAKQLDLDKGVLLFELDAVRAFAAAVPLATEVSRFPMIRRDIAVVVADEVRAADLLAAVQAAAPDLIQSVKIFDIYKGQGIEAGLKSVALGLILQETSRTLTDVDADSAMQAAVAKLQQEFAAVLRD